MISVQGLSKAYKISHDKNRPTTLSETVAHRLRHPFRGRGDTETFWAVKNVSFDVRRGDVVGVIGRNGAGKSTLFKVLSRITEPTTGQVDLYGRVGSLLEVGTGFSGELTGRENIYLNGAILGMRRAEIAKRFDEIVDFAGVERFLDTPVKRYSSGMYVRLAFAVAAHLDTEIMIVDEVLAVGDGDFQAKCLGKIQSVSNSGRTILLVSHNLETVRTACNRIILMQLGCATVVDSVADGIGMYLEQRVTRTTSPRVAAADRPGTGEHRFTHVTTSVAAYKPGETMVISFSIRQHRPLNAPAYVSSLIVDSHGTIVSQLDSRFSGVRLMNLATQTGILKVRSPWLKPGAFEVHMYICSPSASPIIDRYESACFFDVLPGLPYRGAAPQDAISMAATLSDFDWVLD